MNERPPKPIPYSEAQALIKENVAPLGIELISLRKSLGRFLAQSLVAPHDVPHFDNSQVDGYAVFSGYSGSRKICGESAAGGITSLAIRPDEAARIFTGASIPEGADAVVMQEDVTVLNGELIFAETTPSKENIRFRGEEILAGTFFDEFIGKPLTPPIIGLAASFGLPDLTVFRAPKVTVVATGNELVLPGTPLFSGGVYASNPEAIAAALKPFGIDAMIAVVRDDRASTERALRTALEDSDIVITVGGISVGDHDLVRPTLLDLGVEQIVWRVAIKPGKPFFFGHRDAKLVFGLPGNPVSALVTFAALVRPALLQILGDRREEWTSQAILGETIERSDLRYEFLRVLMDGMTVYPLTMQGSHMQTGLALADALLHIPEGVGKIDAGQSVQITPLHWGL